MRSKTIRNTDARIRKMVRANSGEVPGDPWFIRKTVNRLPPSNPPVISLPEIIAFLLVFLAGAGVVAFEMHGYLSGAGLSSGYDPAMLIAALSALAGSALYMAASVLRKCR